MIFATLIGLMLFSFVSLFLSIGLLGAIAAIGNTTPPIAENSVFELKLDGILVERNEENSMAAMLSMMDDSQKQIGLDEILTAIKRAKENENIKGIYLNIGTLSAAPASISEIRNALADFKKSGKFIVAYTDNFANGTYTLASVVDKVAMNPEGMLGINGLAMNTLFFKDALDKLGIEMQIFKVGTFKSAVEPYINTKMSDANRLQMTQLSNSLWDSMLENMAEGRALDKVKINALIDEGIFFAKAQTAEKENFIDTIVYRAEMKNIIENLVGSDYETVKLSAITSQPDETKFSANKIAVVYAVGQIDGGTEDNMDSEKIAETLLKVANDDAVKAVVLRVNSPGGSAFGSEQMWHATQLVKAKKPLIVSMGDYAASGGYYLSCAADSIVAQPTTITGSIGIFGMLPNAQSLTKKIGIDIDGVKTNEFADFGQITRPVTATERALFQQNVERGYELFVKRCADGRQMTTEAIKRIAEGRVWTGADAQKIGLVDVLGGLDKAIEIAVEKAGLTDYNLNEYPAKRDIFTELMENFSVSMETRLLQQKLGNNAQYLNALRTATTMQGVQAMMPFTLIFE